MLRLVYNDGISNKEVWFDSDREALKFSLAGNECRMVLEWKRYKNKDEAKPLDQFPAQPLRVYPV